MENEVKVGRMIKYYLEQNNMTMKQLGNLLGKTESTVSKWIKGTSTPQIKELSSMTFIFKTDMNTLMFGATEIDPAIKMIDIMKRLNEDNQQKVLSYAQKQLDNQ